MGLASRAPARVALLVGVPLLLTGCIQLRWTARNTEDPVSKTAVDSLWPGTDTMETALAKLGAPHFVWEYHGDGAALAWIHQAERDLGLRASYSLSRGPSASFRFDDSQLDVPGVVLWFDGTLFLEKVRQGNLRELTEDLTRRPAPVDPPEPVRTGA